MNCGSYNHNHVSPFDLQILIDDLEVAKKQTWVEKVKRSAKSEEERKVNLANKVSLNIYRSKKTT